MSPERVAQTTLGAIGLTVTLAATAQENVAPALQILKEWGAAGVAIAVMWLGMSKGGTLIKEAIAIIKEVSDNLSDRMDDSTAATNALAKSIRDTEETMRVTASATDRNANAIVTLRDEMQDLKTEIIREKRDSK